MFKNSLQARFIVPVSTFVLLVVLGGALIFSYVEDRRITGEVLEETQQQLDSVRHLLRITDTLTTERANSAIHLFHEKIETLGEASAGDLVEVGSETVRDLLFNRRAQANSFDLVDQMTHIFGGTATLFSRRDTDFIRISTNVKTRVGERAVGTMLDPKGTAYQRLLAGATFYGYADVLGKPYLTAYEPIFDKDFRVVGAFYVGYPVTVDILSTLIADSRVLRKGFLAVVDNKDTVRFHSSNVEYSQAVKVLNGAPGWTLLPGYFNEWGFNVVAAYNNEEVKQISNIRVYSILAVGLTASMVIILTLMFTVRKLVIRPIGGDPIVASYLVAKMAAGDLSVKIPLYPGDQRSLLATLVKMQNGLRRIAAHVTASAKQLTDASEHLTSLSASITEGLHKGTQFTVTLPLESILRQTNLRADISQEDIVRNVDRVTRLNEENTVAAQRVSDDAYRLQTLSAELKQIVGGFKL